MPGTRALVVSLPRPGAAHPWMVPFGLLAIGAALAAVPPWRGPMLSELLNRLPAGYSENQVLVTRTLRRSRMLGLSAEARATLAAKSLTLWDVSSFQQHGLARLRPGVDLGMAQEEARALLADRRVRVFPIRAILLGNSINVERVWLAVLGGALLRAWWSVARRPRWWKYRLYEWLTLAGVALILVLLFANGAEAMDAADRNGAGVPFLVGSLWGLGYIMITAGLLWLWRQDVRTRCRDCVRALRLPLEEGTEGSMLLETPRVERVCFQGHGALTMDRWHDDWRAYRDLWDAFSHRRR